MLYPTELRCSLLIYAALYSYLFAIFLSNAGLSGTGQRGYPSPVPECYGTRLRCWMPEYRCWQHRPWCLCPAMAFWHTFHHNGKVSPGWLGWGGGTPTPDSHYLPSRTKLQCTLQLSGLGQWAVISTPVLCGSPYTNKEEGKAGPGDCPLLAEHTTAFG